MFDFLPKETILEWSKSKEFKNDKIYMKKKLNFVLGREENKKRFSTGYQLSLLFPYCFQKASFRQSLKVVIEWINPFQNKPWFTCLQYKSFENTVGKGEIACKNQFLLLPQCFLPIWRTFCHFHQI